MTIPQHFTLNNGKKIPSIGLGTWQSPTGEVAKAVEFALKAGYRHLDCAWGYQNEGEVGDGIRASGIPREEIFVTSKLFEFHHKPEHVEMAIKDSLQKLGLEYLDLYLLHWQIAFVMDAPAGTLPVHKHTVQENGKQKLDVEATKNHLQTWHAMEALVEKGLTKSIGISNYNINRAKELIAGAKIKPVANEVELSIQCPQPDLIAWLQKNDILPIAYTPLGGTGNNNLRDDKTVVSIAQKNKVQPATVMLSWLLMKGICPIPKSVTPSRIESNFKTVNLSDEDFQALDKLSKTTPAKRVCDQSEGVEPYYDIYQENDPEYSDKAMWAKEQKA